MKALITLDPLRRSYEVRLAREYDGGRYVCATGFDESGYRIEWTEVGQGEDSPVFLRFDPEVFEAILREAAGIMPAADATRRHLDDAIAVRDRLLKIVEER